MGSVVNKYRVHEVAKDFGVATKQVTEILTKYAETPKNHMQVLTDRELSLIFESLTQNNQVAGIHVIFAEGAKAAEKKTEAKPAPAPAQQPQQHKSGAAPARQEQGRENQECRNQMEATAPHRMIKGRGETQ